MQRIPGYATVVFDKPFQVTEEWREWKGTWSVANGQLTMESGPEKAMPERLEITSPKP